MIEKLTVSKRIAYIATNEQWMLQGLVMFFFGLLMVILNAFMLLVDRLRNDPT